MLEIVDVLELDMTVKFIIETKYTGKKSGRCLGSDEADISELTGCRSLQRDQMIAVMERTRTDAINTEFV